MNNLMIEQVREAIEATEYAEASALSNSADAMGFADHWVAVAKTAQICLHALRRLEAEMEPNPLTWQQLNERDGCPVWCVDGAGNAMWCIVNADTKSGYECPPDCIDNESGMWEGMYFEMAGDGKDGLHVLGWRAYDHKPAGEV